MRWNLFSIVFYSVLSVILNVINICDRSMCSFCVPCVVLDMCDIFVFPALRIVTGIIFDITWFWGMSNHKGLFCIWFSIINPDSSKEILFSIMNVDYESQWIFNYECWLLQSRDFQVKGDYSSQKRFLNKGRLLKSKYILK